MIFDDLEGLQYQLKEANNLYPSIISPYLNQAGEQFLKDVKKSTKQLTKKHTGNLLGGYKAERTTTLNARKTIAIEISGGNRKACHYHLVENGHKKFIPTGRKGKGEVKEKGFVPGREMMKSTIGQWQDGQKLKLYAIAALGEFEERMWK